MAFIDWETDDDGDFVLTAGDFADTTDYRAVQQDVLFRLKSGLLSYKPNLDLPAALDELVGRPNSASTGKQIEGRVRKALTWDGRYADGALKVDVVPLGQHELGIYIFLKPSFVSVSNVSNFSFTYDLISGAISLITD